MYAGSLGRKVPSCPPKVAYRRKVNCLTPPFPEFDEGKLCKIISRNDGYIIIIHYHYNDPLWRYIYNYISYHYRYWITIVRYRWFSQTNLNVFCLGTRKKPLSASGQVHRRCACRDPAGPASPRRPRPRGLIDENPQGVLAKIKYYPRIISGWWLTKPLWKIWVPQWGWWQSQLNGKIKNVPNHQPDFTIGWHHVTDLQWLGYKV